MSRNHNDDFLLFPLEPKEPHKWLGWLSFIIKHAVPMFSIAIGCLCVYALQRVPDLRSTPIFCIVQVLLIFDIIFMALRKIHDIPNEVQYFPSGVNPPELFHPAFVTMLLIVQSVRWFSQIFVVPMLSALHILCLFKPLSFRRLRLVHGYMIVALFVSMAIMPTIPLLTNCCIFRWYVIAANWSFDQSGKGGKGTGTEAFTYVNWALQLLCVPFMIICDLLILSKVRSMREEARVRTNQRTGWFCDDISKHHQPTTSSTVTTIAGSLPPTQYHSPAVGSVERLKQTERKLTVSFLLLSLAYIVPSVAFQLRGRYKPWVVSALMDAVFLVIESSKWLVYALSTTQIRREVVRIIKCKMRR